MSLGTTAVVGAVIQARASSRRLPRKIFLKLPFGGRHSLVENIVLRARAARCISTVVVATSVDPSNDPLIEAAARVNAPLFRGSEDDVLSRMIGAADAHGLDVVVRLTGDNPCIDPVHIERAVQSHLSSGSDYTRTTGLPVGMNVEVVSVAALKKIEAAGASPQDREHVTLYINSHPNQFRAAQLDFSGDRYDQIRLTVDWPADYAFACLLYSRLHGTDAHFGLERIMAVLDELPWASLINATLKQKPLQASLGAELEEAIALLDMHGYMRAKGVLSEVIPERESTPISRQG